ncbi:hypothetical protein [Polaromonas naphthalenivorans]|uniref:Uncharacterized protein n=1 Tax=Polaromonas naphthalenivorans (strain CJ2) TaxID=365044 RepID=A1VX78_POLNA|nr:hypothetical protein [Polaromonas naphthalenivorans]ABM40256.1 hypothetical protein Pnap_5008 [Polaromonas naphthalenivorans CJ2]
MYIREQGKKVQLLRSPYDPEKKRCVQKLAHSFPRSYSYSSTELDTYLSAEQIADLSDDEKKELTEWLTVRSDKNLAESRKSSITMTPYYADQLADNISSDVVDLSEKQADKIWDAMDKLAKAMRKAGYKKPAVKAAPGAQAGSADQPSLTL